MTAIGELTHVATKEVLHERTAGGNERERERRSRGPPRCVCYLYCENKYSERGICEGAKTTKMLNFKDKSYLL